MNTPRRSVPRPGNNPPPAGQPPSALGDRARMLLRDVLLPFRAGVPLRAAARWRVALLWALLGALIAAVWSLALVLAFARAPLDAALLVVALVAGGALFFGGLGYLLVGLGNRLIARDQPTRPPVH